MKKMPRIVFLVAMFAMLGTQVVSAQLINYGRRAGSPAPRNVNDETAPKWAKELPKVVNSSERRYDINRDGLLQSAEVKVMLRDVIETVEERGSVIVYSDILKDYDANKDRYITPAELDKIREDVKG